MSGKAADVSRAILSWSTRGREAKDLADRRDDAGGVRFERHVALLDLGQILDLTGSRFEFVFTRNEGHAEAAPVSVLELLAEFSGVGKDLGTEAGGAEGRGQFQIIV